MTCDAHVRLQATSPPPQLAFLRTAGREIKTSPQTLLIKHPSYAIQFSSALVNHDVSDVMVQFQHYISFRLVSFPLSPVRFHYPETLQSKRDRCRQRSLTHGRNIMSILVQAEFSHLKEAHIHHHHKRLIRERERGTEFPLAPTVRHHHKSSIQIRLFRFGLRSVGRPW